MSQLSTSANRVTLVRMVLIPVFLVILLARLPVWGPWLAAAVFTLLAATDVVDGYLARSRNEVTTFGKFIDPLADKLLVTAALVALVDLDRLPSWIALVIISRELVVSGLRLVAVAEGRVIAASSFGKVKTVFQIIAIVGFIVKDSALVPQYLGERGAAAFGWLAWAVMVAAVVLTILSMIDYFYHARDIITGPWSRGRDRDAEG
jgi:CDP-diacylglycerol--glycerol-3-phosphate 3-phosphatidyltransferase